ncbi:hypothetical protein ACQZV8_21225 [Magnetococcales bacterium HHB-1]
MQSYMFVHIALNDIRSQFKANGCGGIANIDQGATFVRDYIRLSLVKNITRKKLKKRLSSALHGIHTIERTMNRCEALKLQS